MNAVPATISAMSKVLLESPRSVMVTQAARTDSRLNILSHIRDGTMDLKGMRTKGLRSGKSLVTVMACKRSGRCGTGNLLTLPNSQSFIVQLFRDQEVKMMYIPRNTLLKDMLSTRSFHHALPTSARLQTCPYILPIAGGACKLKGELNKSLHPAQVCLDFMKPTPSMLKFT